MIEGSLKYIPIDFIKAEITGLSKEMFHRNPRIGIPKTQFVEDVLHYTLYKYKNLSIKIFENSDRIIFAGSLHTFFNNGIHNYNDFDYSCFELALERLSEELGIEPKNLRILQLEWGFNITPPKPSNYILDRLVHHRSVPPTKGKDSMEDGHYLQFVHSDYRLKVYDKAKHFDLKGELLRIEMKQTNWKKYRKMGIVTFSDFIACEKEVFYKELISQWQRIVFYDIDNNITENYIRYALISYWKDLRKATSNKNFKYHFDKLELLNFEKGYNCKTIISNSILAKGNKFQLKV